MEQVGQTPTNERAARYRAKYPERVKEAQRRYRDKHRKRLDGRRRCLEFIELDTGCYVCVSHKTNPDGYLRWNTGNGNKLEMFHRIIWKMHKGPIPEGYEIDHLCHNRACLNVDHMECIDGSEHAIKSNKERWVRDDFQKH